MTYLTVTALLLLSFALHVLGRQVKRRAIAREFRALEQELSAQQMPNEPRPSARRPVW